MAINEANILRDLERQNVGKYASKVYINSLTVLADQIVQDFKDVIEKETRSDNGALRQSVTAVPNSDGFEIDADFYYKFIDDGVSGVGSFKGVPQHRQVVTGAPFQFKNLFVPRLMAQSIREWSGASMAQSYAIGVNIKNYGIKPKDITEQVWNDATIERVSEDLSEITGLAVTVVFDQIFNQD
jgi:hypothetical protein